MKWPQNSKESEVAAKSYMIFLKFCGLFRKHQLNKKVNIQQTSDECCESSPKRIVMSHFCKKNKIILTSIKWEISSNSCGLLRITEF